MRRDTCPVEWAAYVEGELTVSRTRELESHLAGCARCRRTLADHRTIVRLLGRTDDVLQHVDLLPSLLDETGKSCGNRLPRGRWVLPAAAALLAIACVALCWLLSDAGPVASPDRSGVRAKAVRGGVPDADRWVAILPHRLIEDGRTRRLGERMAQRDALLVAYTNLGPEPYSCLMVFAVDAQGTIHWLHPAYRREGENPASVSIHKGAAVEIPEAVWHDFSPGTLRVVGLFSRRPYRVEEIERMVGALWDDGVWWESTRLPIEDTGQHIVTTEVVP